jgi:hypothetical protein
MVEADIQLRLLPTSILDMYKLFEVLLCRLTGIWEHLHHSTSQVGWIFLSFVEGKQFNYIMVEADIHLRLLPTSILDKQSV